MGYCKKDITPVLMHWSYVFLLVQERRNSIANALELRLFRTDPSILKQAPMSASPW